MVGGEDFKLNLLFMTGKIRNALKINVNTGATGGTGTGGLNV